MLLRFAAIAIAVACALVLPAAAPAKDVDQGFMQIVSYAPLKIWEDVASIPLRISDEPRRVRIRAGNLTYVGVWANVSVSRELASDALGEVHRDARPPRSSGNNGVFVDRPLTARERRRFVTVADLYRDADVLVVAAGHPACAAGLTRAQARDVARGRITRWSEVTPGAPEGAIRVRHFVRRTDPGPHPRLGLQPRKLSPFNYAPVKYARGAKGTPDGGLAAAAGGDRSIAAITSWSQARGWEDETCAVPIDGVIPSDETVMSLRYAYAYPVAYVFPRGRPSRYERALRREWIGYLRSDRVKRQLQGRGLLLVGGAPPPLGADGGPVAAPRTDHAGRTITPVRDHAAANVVLDALGLERPSAGGTLRYVLEQPGPLAAIELDAGGNCTGFRGGSWRLLGGWRYAEHGGGLVIKVGWNLREDPAKERTLFLPAAEPGTGYVDGDAYSRIAGARPECVMADPPAATAAS